MEKYYLKYSDSFTPPYRFASCIGVFDGFHIGHKKIIKKVCDLAKEEGLHSLVMTFSSTIKKDNEQIFDLETKLEKIAECGVDACVVFMVDDDFASMPYYEFEEKYLKNAEVVVLGSDFTYGANREGSIKTLKEKVRTYCVDDECLESYKVSSSKIKEYLKIGNIAKASKMLGDNFKIRGKVVSGNKIGTILGIKTANILYPDNIVRLASGVYETNAWVNGKPHKSITNVGTNPTIDGKTLTIETHLLDYESDLYGEEITVEFISFLRTEIKFASLDELKKQILADIRRIRK